jgi:hypothetical protein
MEQNNKLMDQNLKLITSVTGMGDELKDLRQQVTSLQSPAGSPYLTPNQDQATKVSSSGELVHPAATKTLAPALPSFSFSTPTANVSIPKSIPGFSFGPSVVQKPTETKAVPTSDASDGK